jgi:hypothetical protein
LGFSGCGSGSFDAAAISGQDGRVRGTILLRLGAFLFLTPFFSCAWAGSVVSLENGQAVEGKLTFSAAAIHVEGSSASDIKLTDVLEADFNDAPFHLQYFQSDGDSGNQLPAGWTAKAIGPADPAEAASYTAGTLTITGGGSGFGEPHPDHCFFAGMPWKGDGEWTAHLK